GGWIVHRMIARRMPATPSRTSASRLARGLACGLTGMSLVCCAASCAGRPDSPTPSTKPQGQAFQGKRPAPAETGPKTPADELTAELSAILNKEEIRYATLQYEYDEGLLATIDKAEAYLSGRLKGPAPRAMPKLTEQEEYDHLREVIRRWHAQSG